MSDAETLLGLKSERRNTLLPEGNISPGAFGWMPSCKREDYS